MSNKSSILNPRIFGITTEIGRKSLQKTLGIKGTIHFGISNKEGPIELPSKLQVGIFGILLILILILSLSNDNSFQLGTYMDDASYAVLAQSIAFSETYGLINVPGKPLPVRYPPGFPILLSPFARLFSNNMNSMQVLSLLATLLNASLLFFGWPYLCQNKSYWWGLIIATLYSISPTAISHTHMVMSEPAFTTFTLAALILVEKYLSRNGKLPIFLLGVVTSFAYLIRSVGIIIWFAIMARIIFTRSPKESIKLLGYLVSGGITLIIIVVLLTPVAIPDLIPLEYLNQLFNPQLWAQNQVKNAFIPRLLSAFLNYIGQHLREAVIPIGGGQRELELGRRFGLANLPLLTGLIIGCLILLGIFAFLSKQGVTQTVLLFEVLYFSVILLWPWREKRFLYPILPFLYYHLLMGILLVVNRLKSIKPLSSNTNRLLSHICVGITIFALFLISLYKGINNNQPDVKHTRDLQTGTLWLKKNSPKDALIMAQQPQSIYIYSERKTIDYSYTLDLTELEKEIHEQHIDYILVAPQLEWRADGSLAYDEYTRKAFLPFLNTLTEEALLKLVYEAKKDMVKIYQVIETP